jgi:hypothetical protein
MHVRPEEKTMYNGQKARYRALSVALTIARETKGIHHLYFALGGV